jgi:Na+:H+ antiporter, NhaA family
LTGTAASPPRPGPPSRLWQPAFTLSLRRFLATEVGSGLLLVSVTAFALLWANSPWWESYERLWSTIAGVRLGSAELMLDLRHWVDDGLMTLFFWWWDWR